MPYVLRLDQPNYREKRGREREREIRKFARNLNSRWDLSLDEMNELYDKLIEGVKNYGTF